MPISKAKQALLAAGSANGSKQLYLLRKTPKAASTVAPGLELRPLPRVWATLLAGPRCPVPRSVVSSGVSWVLLCH